MRSVYASLITAMLLVATTMNTGCVSELEMSSIYLQFPYEIEVVQMSTLNINVIFHDYLFTNFEVWAEEGLRVDVKVPHGGEVAYCDTTEDGYDRYSSDCGGTLYWLVMEGEEVQVTFRNMSTEPMLGYMKMHQLYD